MHYYHMTLADVLELMLPQYVWLCEEVKADGPQ